MVNVNGRVSGSGSGARSSKAARRVRRAERASQSKRKSGASESESEAPADGESAAAAGAGARPMVGAALRGELEKQGYRVVGSHSGVKLCRWTKSSLRGRGGCYKHTFYGIESHRCVEATPSMACANKCVFCWRHHTNPVATEWKWDVDDPHLILDRVRCFGRARSRSSHLWLCTTLIDLLVLVLDRCSSSTCR